jgi:menaquinol-cytochrome c reductase iron-sulfur subunit
MAEADLSRRQFLNTAINAVGAVMTAMIAVPIAGYFMDPVLRSASGAAGTWVKLAGVSELGDAPKKFTISAEKVEGFMKQKVAADVYAFKDGDKMIAMSNTCQHLGCPVAYTESDGKFHCPCHGGVYDKQGTNIGGPPPRPLARYATKVENGDLMIMLT